MRPDLHADITARLLRDYAFKDRGTWLREGKCPECGKKELYVSAEHPRVLRCGRLNQCGAEIAVKDVYRDLFERWSDRFLAQPEDPNAAADAYLQYARGFDLTRLRGLYRQEYYHSRELGIGSATVRFDLGDGVYWERIIDEPDRFGKRKAGFGYGQKYGGRWWCLPDTAAEPSELWLAEGIFDAIALELHGKAARSLMSCNVYPQDALAQLAAHCAANSLQRPTLVWAFDAGAAGEGYAVKFAERARDEGWTCRAAQIPQPRRGKVDWNDLHLRGRLTDKDFAEYLYQGDLLLAPSAKARGLLMYKRRERGEFHFRHGNQLYWFKFDDGKYNKAKEDILKGARADALSEEEIREEALEAGGVVSRIASCYPEFLYYQSREVTDEAWYYLRISYPHAKKATRHAFTASHLSSGAEFAKRLMHCAPGCSYTGSTAQLQRIYDDMAFDIKCVSTVDFIGYSREHGAWIFDKLAVAGGKVHHLNDEDYFEIGRTAVKSLNASLKLAINPDPKSLQTEWLHDLWACYGPRGIVALAFWTGTLFAEQLRARRGSYPFIEMAGMPGTGKTLLVELLWKLVGRTGYEGMDPNKSTASGRARTFMQVAGLPIVLTEGDRNDDKPHNKAFDWNEIKPLFNGVYGRSIGVRNGQNDTYEPPFRGAVMIEQNQPVNSDRAVMERIVSMIFDKSRHTADNKARADRLKAVDVQDVSAYAIVATAAEDKLLAFFDGMFPIHLGEVLANPKSGNYRIAENHATLMALVACLRMLLPLSDAMVDQTHALLREMAVEREYAIEADHRHVTVFWELFDHLQDSAESHRPQRDPADPRDPLDDPELDTVVGYNHSRHSDELAINLPEIESALNRRGLRLPAPMVDLQDLLRSSRRRRFVDANRSVKSAITHRSKRCWIFRQEPTA